MEEDQDPLKINCVKCIDGCSCSECSPSDYEFKICPSCVTQITGNVPEHIPEEQYYQWLRERLIKLK